jgi:hypothetical protein
MVVMKKAWTILINRCRRLKQDIYKLRRDCEWLVAINAVARPIQRLVEPELATGRKILEEKIMCLDPRVALHLMSRSTIR